MARWAVYMAGGRWPQYLGVVSAADERLAPVKAIRLFSIPSERQPRVSVALLDDKH
jgi:hypothetical protein